MMIRVFSNVLHKRETKLFGESIQLKHDQSSRRKLASLSRINPNKAFWMCHNVISPSYITVAFYTGSVNKEEMAVMQLRFRGW